MSVLVDRFVRDTRFALRRLIRHPIFTTFSILTLAAGVGVTTAAYSGVALTTSAGLRLPESETVVFLTTAGTRRPQTTPRIHLSDVAELSRQQHSFEAVAAFLTLSTSVSARGNARLTQVEAVTSEYFDAIRARASLGRLISAGDTAPGSSPVVVLSHQAWRSEFNSDPAVLGSSIHIGGVAATVIGVASPDVHGAGALFSFQRRAWIPLPVGLRLRHHGASAVTQGSDPFLTVFGRLKAGTTLETAQAEIGIIGGRLETAKRPDPSGSGQKASGRETRRIEPAARLQ